MSQAESKRIAIGEEHILETANGERNVNEHIALRLPHVGLASSARAMDDCPSMLSVGKLVEANGFRQLWDPQLGYLLQDPHGQWYRVPVNNCIPEINIDDLEQIQPPDLSFLDLTPPPVDHFPSDGRVGGGDGSDEGMESSCTL